MKIIDLISFSNQEFNILKYIRSFKGLIEDNKSELSIFNSPSSFQKSIIQRIRKKSKTMSRSSENKGSKSDEYDDSTR